MVPRIIIILSIMASAISAKYPTSAAELLSQGAKDIVQTTIVVTRMHTAFIFDAMSTAEPAPICTATLDSRHGCPAGCYARSIPGAFPKAYICATRTKTQTSSTTSPMNSPTVDLTDTVTRWITNSGQGSTSSPTSTALQISSSSPIFPNPSEHRPSFAHSSGGIATITILVLLGITGLLTAVFLLWRRRWRSLKPKMQPGDDEDSRTLQDVESIQMTAPEALRSLQGQRPTRDQEPKPLFATTAEDKALRSRINDAAIRRWRARLTGDANRNSEARLTGDLETGWRRSVAGSSEGANGEQRTPHRYGMRDNGGMRNLYHTWE